MAEAGGRADKLGNEYERLWGVHLLLEVLNGNAVYVIPEPSSEEGQGIDFIVAYANNKKVAYQCKQQNSSRGNWTVGRLATEDIFTNSLAYIKRDSSHHFCFVSRDPAPDIRELHERISHYKDDPSIFYNNLPKDLTKAYGEIDALLSINISLPQGKQQMFDFLSRCESILFDHNRGTDRTNIRSTISSFIHGEPDQAILVLKKLLLDSMGCEIRLEHIYAELEESGFTIFDPSTERPKIYTAMKALASYYKRQFLPIGNNLIDRQEARDLVNQIESDEDNRIFCIHGNAGCGKSGVLRQVCDILEEKSITYLPLRLDRQSPKVRNTIKYGEELNLLKSPTLALSLIADGRPCVFIIDQLDAIRWTSSHSTDAWDVVQELINEAVMLPNMRVVIACRTYDLQENQFFIQWRENQKDLTEIQIHKLNEDIVKGIVDSQGGTWDGLTNAQKELLRIPQMLWLWTQLNPESRVAQTFLTQTSLMNAFWNELRTIKAREGQIAVADINATLDIIIKYMDQRGILVAPEGIISNYLEAINFLRSNHVFLGDGQISFSHQSHFEYLLAENLTIQIVQEKTTALKWLMQHSQSLFRRNQLRILLQLLRDQSPIDYIKNIRELLQANEVRFHMKHLVLGILSNATNIFKEEADYVISLIENPNWREKVYSYVFWRRPAWFDILIERDLISAWLDSDKTDELNLAIKLCQVFAESRGKEVAILIRPYLCKGGTWWQRITDIFTFIEPHEADSFIFSIQLFLIGVGEWSKQEFRHVDWKKLAKYSPNRCLRLFKISIQQYVKNYPEREPNSYHIPKSRIRWIGWQDGPDIISAARQEPEFAWRIFSHWLISLPDSTKEDLTHYPSFGNEKHLSHQHELQLDGILLLTEKLCAEAAGQLSSSDASAFLSVVDATMDSMNAGVARAILSGLLSLDINYADEALEVLLKNPFCLDIGHNGHESKWEPAAKVIERFAPNATQEVVDRLVNEVWKYKDPDLKRSYELRRKYLHKPNDPSATNIWGLAQHVLLAGVPISKMTSKEASTQSGK